MKEKKFFNGVVWVLLILAAFSLALFGCNSTPDGIPSGAIKADMTTKDWIAGKKYHERGRDTTIYSEPFQKVQFNLYANKYDTVWYQESVIRDWEHKYTAGGMKEPILYWDEPSKEWYVFNRSGGYFVYKWRHRIRKVNHGG